MTHTLEDTKKKLVEEFAQNLIGYITKSADTHPVDFLTTALQRVEEATREEMVEEVKTMRLTNIAENIIWNTTVENVLARFKTLSPTKSDKTESV